MGIKINNNQDLEMNDLKEKLAALGLEIELPKDDEDSDEEEEEETSK